MSWIAKFAIHRIKLLSRKEDKIIKTWKLSSFGMLNVMKITVSLKCTEFTFGFAGMLYFCCSQRLSENLRRCRLSTFWILITLTSILHLCFSFYLFHIVGSSVTLEIKDILYAIIWLEPDLGKQKDGENPCCNKLPICTFVHSISTSWNAPFSYQRLSQNLT